MPLPAHILVHEATPLETDVGDESSWVEGEPGGTADEPELGQPFPCVLFLPAPGGEQTDQYRPRVVTQPTLLYNATRDDDTAIVLGYESEVLIDAPELANFAGAETQRFQLVGEPQPFGPPGRVFGVQATLRLVRG